MRKQKVFIKFVLIILLLFSFITFISNDVLAREGEDECADGKCGVVKLKNPLGDDASDRNINLIIANIINVVLGVVGSLALLMFIYGGFTWMTAAGNTERVTKGKNILIWATIGLVVIFASYALVEFVIRAIS